MYPIQELQWGQVNIHTWQQLSPHMWECFRLSLMESETDQEVQGVIVRFSKAFNEIETEQKAQGVRVEHSPTINSTETEMIVNIVVSKRDYKSAMLNYLPYYERHSIIFNEILNAYDKEFRRLEQDTQIVDRNMLLDTAVESLDIFERDLGIEINKKLNYKQRREQVSARNRSSFEQTTEETIKNVAIAFSNGEVEVNKTDIVGVFEIKFIGAKGIPDNIEGLKEALDIIIPAHLGLTYTFTFNAWEQIKELTWNNCLSKTWNELRTWEGVI